MRSVPFDLRRWGENYASRPSTGRCFANTGASPSTSAMPASTRKSPSSRRATPCWRRSTSRCCLPSPPAPLPNLGKGVRYAAFGDPEGQREGVFWFVEGEVTDGSGAPAGKRVFCLYQTVMAWSSRSTRPSCGILSLYGGSSESEASGLNINLELTGLLQQRDASKTSSSPRSCCPSGRRSQPGASERRRSRRSTACARWTT